MVVSSRLQAFRNLPQKIQEMPEFSAWLQQGTPEQCVPQLWDEKKQLSAIGTAMYQLLVIQVSGSDIGRRRPITWNILNEWFFQAFRADRAIAAAHIFVDTVLGEEFMMSAERELNLSLIVEKDIRANVPVLLCSVPGYDASGRVDDLAAELGKQIASIAIGSAEGFNQATNVINAAVRTGKWVLIV